LGFESQGEGAADKPVVIILCMSVYLYEKTLREKMKKELIEQITCALNCPSPADALIVVATKFRNEGIKQDELFKLFESIFVILGLVQK